MNGAPIILPFFQYSCAVASLVFVSPMQVAGTSLSAHIPCIFLVMLLLLYNHDMTYTHKIEDKAECSLAV